MGLQNAQICDVPKSLFGLRADAADDYFPLSVLSFQ